MIQLTDKLIAVVIPEVKDNRYFKLWDDSERKEWIIECQHENGDISIIKNLGNIDGYYIIGTVTKSGEFDFDCEKYVLCTDLESHKLFGDGKWKNYNSEYPYYHETKEESFISLLQSKGISLGELNNEKILILEKL
jgi:hypothetical protein